MSCNGEVLITYKLRAVNNNMMDMKYFLRKKIWNFHWTLYYLCRRFKYVNKTRSNERGQVTWY
jgi:deoxyadenosine/deoxycytidine kinase